MSHSDGSSSNETSSDRRDRADQPNERKRKPRSHVIVGVGVALAGAVMLAYSLRFFLFRPMTATDEFIGPRMWIVGSWLLGGGITFAFARPWVAVLVGFFSPALTFGIGMLLYFALILLAPMLS